jgi:hypothetical protein
MENEGLQKPQKPWIKPAIQSETIYETTALGCAQCANGRPGTELGWGDGNCEVSFMNY